MKALVWIFIAVLVVLHQDFWLWDNDKLVFGFMPITLAYHACISIAAGVAWFMAINFAWPADLEEETLDAIQEQEGSPA